VEPYYEHNGITIYHGDCREIMPGIEADAVVTDPPYGTGAHGFTSVDFSDVLPDAALGEYAARAIFGRLPEMLPLLAPSPDLVVTWWPSNGACIGRSRVGVHRQAHQIAFWGAVGEVRNQFASPTSIRMGWEKPGLMADVWTDPHPHAGFQKRGYAHPTQKPVAVMSRCIELLGVPGTILDPFMGSGTTLRAAKDLGRKAIGIEIEERYCEIAAKRLAQEVLDFG